MPNSPYEKRRASFGHCHACLRPAIDCFCAEIPSIANQTKILILQHRRERRHPFNTVRITERALTNCQVAIGYKEAFATAPASLAPDAGLLYPGVDAMLLSDCLIYDKGYDMGHDKADGERPPSQLVILDGTWHHTKTFVRDIAWLRALPRYRIEPPEPSRYRIREEPTLQSLSTLEATAAALYALEPQTAGIAQMVRAFDKMVEGQLAHPCNPHGSGK